MEFPATILFLIEWRIPSILFVERMNNKEIFRLFHLQL